MAKEKYFPFRSVLGDRKYSAEDWAAYFAQFIGNGVFYNSADRLKVAEYDGMKVKVQKGAGFVEGRMYLLEEDQIVKLDTADGVVDRIDRIVLRCDYNNRLMTVAVKKGGYGANPTAPKLTRDTGVYELALADVYIAAGAVTITAANITDQRFNTSLCGIVTGLVEQADTEEIFSQFQAAFEEWFKYVKDVLSEDEAGNLLALIETKASKAEVEVERARINALTKMEPGSTTGDAELQDIRIGADGVTYENAGEAVRKQVSKLSSEIEELDITKLDYNSTIVTSGNYSTILPDANNAPKGIIKMNFANGSTDIPANLPFTEWVGGINTLITFTHKQDATYKSQLLINATNIYYRYGGNTLTTWYIFNDVFTKNKFLPYVPTTINKSNYASYMPNADTVGSGVYRLLFANGSTDIPLNLPFDTWQEGTIATMMCFKQNDNKYSTQIFITTESIYYRLASDTYTAWNRIATNPSNNFYRVKSGESIIEGIKTCYKKGYSKMVVESGKYDIIAEYKAHYGEDYFDNYTGYTVDSDKFDRGIWLENIEVVFSAGALVKCIYDGNNNSVTQYFSAFATGDNVIIDGLVLDSENLRYGIHSDYSETSNRSHLVVKNCDLKHFKTNDCQAMGCGFGASSDWLIENTIFRSNGANRVFRVHNSSLANAQSRLMMKDCYVDGEGYFIFNDYGASTLKSTVKVCGCSYITEPVNSRESSDTWNNDNVEMILWNNEKRES